MLYLFEAEEESPKVETKFRLNRRQSRVASSEGVEDAVTSFTLGQKGAVAIRVFSLAGPSVCRTVALDCHLPNIPSCESGCRRPEIHPLYTQPLPDHIFPSPFSHNHIPTLRDLTRPHSALVVHLLIAFSVVTRNIDILRIARLRRASSQLP